MGGDDDDAAGDVKVNGLANDEKATEVGEAGDSSTLLNLNQVALKIGRIARDAGDAEDAGWVTSSVVAVVVVSVL